MKVKNKKKKQSKTKKTTRNAIVNAHTYKLQN